MNSLEDFKEDALQRITRVEEKVENQDKRIGSLETDNKVLARLAILIEKQDERIEKHDLQMERQHETLIEMSNSMKEMSNSYKNLDGRVGKLETNDSNKKIDLGILAKHVLFSVIPTLVAAYLLFRFGLK
jgi:methyl-accepting chemotaxis protein